MRMVPRSQLRVNLEAVARALRIAANRQGIKIGRDRADPQCSIPDCVLAPNLTNPIFVTHLLRKMLDTLRTELHDRPGVAPRYGADQFDRREASRFCVRGRLCCSVRFA